MNSSCLTPQLSPDISLSSNLSSVPSFHGSHPAVLVVSKAENSGNLFQEISSPTSADKAVTAFKMMLAQEFVRPWPLLITYRTSFSLLITCLPVICPVWLNSFLNQWGISICPGWLEQAYIEPNLHTLYTYIFWTIWLIDLLTLEESYRRIGLAFTADLSFNLSFDRAILKNLSHWLGLQTCEGCPCIC